MKHEKPTKTSVEQLREIRDEIGEDIQNMTFEQLQKYIDERLTLHPKTVWK